MPTPDFQSRPELRGSAALALRSAAKVFVVVIVCSPVRWIVARVFQEDAVFDWKLALILSTLLSLAWFIAAFLSGYFDLRKLDRIDRETNPRFPGTSFLRGLYGGMIVFSVVMELGLYRQGDEAWMQLIPLIFIGMSVYAWPRTIHCDERTIWQWSRLGRKRAIDFEAIESIARGAGGTITVIGPDITIEHTSSHAGAEEFCRFLSERTGKPVY
jgi:hypothetical protein